MTYIHQVEEQLDEYIKKHNLNSPKGINLILNRTFINRNISLGSSSVCLHFATKYEGLHWPQLCVDDGDNIVLFIGRRY